MPAAPAITAAHPVAGSNSSDKVSVEFFVNNGFRSKSDSYMFDQSFLRPIDGEYCSATALLAEIPAFLAWIEKLAALVINALESILEK